MDLTQLSAYLERDAAWVVFLNVLLEQAGLPVPAVPTLLMAGSIAASGGQLGLVLLAATVGSLIADAFWYAIGRRYGYQVLAGLCKISINPGSCVSQTEARFMRWGLKSLVIAKFIPGFSTVAPPIAGALRMPLPGFLIASAIGAALWAGIALVAGWAMRTQVRAAILILEEHSGRALALIVIVAGAWIGWKLWKKYRFHRLARISHVTIDELLAAMKQSDEILLLDLRGPTLIAAEGPIAGATVTNHDRLLTTVRDWPKNQPIVTLCACPQDASAIQAASTLRKSGYHAAKPLRGGYEAWAKAALAR